MKSICFVITNAITVNSFFIDHLNFLKKKFSITLITNQSNLKSSKLLKIKIIDIPFSRKINLLNDIISFFKLFIFFYKNKFNLTVSVTPKAGFFVTFIAFLLNYKFIHYFTGQHWITKKYTKFFFKFLDQVTSYKANIILCDGNEQKKFLIKNNIVKKNKIKVLGNGSISGVDTNIYNRNIKLRINLRKKLKIPLYSIVLLFLGRLNKDKGIEILLDSFNQLNVKKKVVLLLVGPDELKLRNKKINNKNIFIFPKYYDPKKFFNISDIFINPSFREGFGLSVIEASSYKLPIICSNIYGLKNSFIKNKTGLDFKSGNSQELTKQLSKLISNRKLRSIMGKNGRIFVQKKFEKKLVISNFYSFLKKFLK